MFLINFSEKNGSEREFRTVFKCYAKAALMRRRSDLRLREPECRA